jgi:hypothetical protein
MLRYLAFALPVLIDPQVVYHGRSGNLEVRPPRLEAEIEVDGRLTEEKSLNWKQEISLDKI